MQLSELEGILNKEDDSAHRCEISQKDREGAIDDDIAQEQSTEELIPLLPHCRPVTHPNL